MRYMKIKIIDFDKSANISKDFKDRVGLYDPKRNTIYLDRSLPKYNNGTIRSTLEHEKAHALLRSHNLKLRSRREEVLAILISVCATPSKYQSQEEVLFKRLICGPLTWRVNKGVLFERLLSLSRKF
jgi:hypothetical protein